MAAIGDCFVVLTPNCSAETVIFGRNAVDATALGEAQEVQFYSADASAKGKCDGGAEPEIDGETLRLILQKPRPGCWGGDCGANERNICIGVSWTGDEATVETGNFLRSTDVVRYALATACSAAEAVERIGALVSAHGADNAKCSYIVCDPSEAWAVSSGGTLWAAQRFTDGYHRFPTDGLAVSQTIDKSTESLGDALQTLGVWSGEGALDFAASFGAASIQGNDINWSGEAPSGDGTYALTSMFATLRSAADVDESRSASVSVLSGVGISCHWFTGTPNVGESVFKPFVFAPNPRISPLTKAAEDSAGPLTLLHQLHAMRKPTAVEDLKTLETSCVDEVAKYLEDHPSVDDELDDLMKDCVEAEVKFYR